ncbi:hypothetical protein AB0L06_12120 [Spirillospora sp. NPDC052269]
MTFSSGTGTGDTTGRHARVRRRDRNEPWPAEPLWPAPDPARDREILLALASHEAGAEGRLYDAYAARLHDYAASVLREGPAADIVHDVLVDAARRAARARDRERLGAWLYAATRARIRRRTFPRPHWDWSAAHGDPRPAVSAQVRDTLDHLMAVTGPTERELLLLTGRHGLTTDDLEGVLGRPARGLRRRCALAWRHAAEIVAAHTAASAATDGDLRISSSPSPFKVSGATPPNGLPYTAPDPARQAAYSPYGTPPDERPFVPPGPSPHNFAHEPDGVLFASRPPAGTLSGPYETSPGGGSGRGVSSGGMGDSALRVEVLLVTPVVPPPPQRLRMRVLHTLADPELAPYRAEIRARGGRLTPQGLPRQPDATSPATRRTRRAGLRTTLTGAAAVTGVRTSAAATATVGTALVPLFLVPASTPSIGLGLVPGHGGHSITSPLNGELPEPLPDRPAHDSGVGLPAAELPAVSLTPPEGAGTPVIIDPPKYPDVPAISGGVPGGPVLPVRPPELLGTDPLPVPFAPPHLLRAVPQIVDTVPQIVDAVPQVVRDVPDVVRSIPQVVRAVPRVLQDVPDIVQSVPRTLQDVPKVVEGVPKTLQDVPRVVQNVPKVVRDVPNVVQNVPKVVQDLPDAVSELTGAAVPSGQGGGPDVAGAVGGGPR